MLEGLATTIIPVYNRPGMLREATASVLSQTYRPIEIIIVDDGSIDETATVADELVRENPREISVVHQRNTGVGLAREAGRQRARGEFIQHLDSDDLLLPEKFEMQVAGLRSHPECGVAYGKTRFCTPAGGSSAAPWKRTGELTATMFPSMLQSRWWGTSTPLYRRQLTDLAGPWKSLRNDEDWEYDCRIAALGVRLYYVDRFVSDERDHAGARLSGRGSGPDAKAKLSDRAAAHAMILEHAFEAGIDPSAPEMQHFARELFLLSRQCGAVGLAGEAKQMFELSRFASGSERSKGWDFRLYGLGARLIGWSHSGKIACLSDNLRK
jgi:glycosyltransferase involved in cell wall biosynthesis